jgi:hypothetical protein
MLCFLTLTDSPAICPRRRALTQDGLVVHAANSRSNQPTSRRPRDSRSWSWIGRSTVARGRQEDKGAQCSRKGGIEVDSWLRRGRTENEEFSEVDGLHRYAYPSSADLERGYDATYLAEQRVIVIDAATLCRDAAIAVVFYFVFILFI